MTAHEHNNLGWAGLMPHLLMAQQAVQAVGKASRNDYSGYNYASAEDMITASREVLHANGIVVTRNGWRIVDTSMLNASDKPVNAVEAMYIVAHESGSHVACVTQYPICTKKGTPEDKALNASLTTGLSYFLRDLLLIPRCDEEVDRRHDKNVKVGVRPTPKPSGRSNKEQFMGNVASWINRDITESDTADACIAILKGQSMPIDGSCTPSQFGEASKIVETFIADGIEPDTILALS